MKRQRLLNARKLRSFQKWLISLAAVVTLFLLAPLDTSAQQVLPLGGEQYIGPPGEGFIAPIKDIAVTDAHTRVVPEPSGLLLTLSGLMAISHWRGYRHSR